MAKISFIYGDDKLFRIVEILHVKCKVYINSAFTFQCDKFYDIIVST